MDAIIKTFRFLWLHKWKSTFLLSMISLFLLLLFPFKDLNDFISAQIAGLTQNKIYLQFEDMHVNPLTASVSLDQVTLETAELESLNIASISASPSFAALLKRQPGGTVSLDGLFGGQAEMKLIPLETLESGALKAQIDFSSDNLSLRQIHQTFKLSIPFTGSTNIKTSITADLSFKEQPNGDLSIIINNFIMPSTTLNTAQMGSLNLPELKFKQIDIKGKLASGKFVIENAKLGNASDDFSGTLKGDINIRLENMGGQIQPQIGGYNLNIDLQAKPAFVQRAQFFLGFIDQFKTESNGISRYRLKLQAANAQMPPSFLPLN